jgi:hypothetical protein
MHNQLPKSPTLKQKQAKNLSTSLSLFFSASLNEILSTYQRKNKKPNRLFFLSTKPLATSFFLSFLKHPVLKNSETQTKFQRTGTTIFSL